jgi:hypothetical protein
MSLLDATGSILIQELAIARLARIKCLNLNTRAVSHSAGALPGRVLTFAQAKANRTTNASVRKG